MESTLVHLFKANDAEDAYAIRLEGDPPTAWRTERGYGGNFEKVWSVEFQSDTTPNWLDVDWDTVLDRTVEACHLSDSVIANFDWPLRERTRRGKPD